ncbi:ABC transporter ATP-binding protein [Lujinxingia vulgaris]|uniref:ABC transporter ATP-binding protein n=1 Tax=Lujinxingia vulgaris TaxID=2600176 RepID=A0A5C6X7F7_9DELT|nr:ABC transporter ATP-binding protein [Lujinxingia vulgaris]TXD37774.1 ABC transporter ATP-binding protein [Lujinxingia vulgaris]
MKSDETSGTPGTDDVLLKVRDLKTYFDTDDGEVRAVDGVSFEIKRGECVGVVGESGSGKSVCQISILGLIPSPPGRIAGGEVTFDGRDLLGASKKQLRSIRGNEISMIWQDPMSSLNPFLKISRQLIEPLQTHQGLSKEEAREKAIAMLEKVGIPGPRERIDQYPHQFSGGMRQRVMIAMALLCEPKLLIADEPTTALDVTIQAQILELIKDLRTDLGTSVIVITHDLGVVAGMADRIIVMYAGRVMEVTAADKLFESPGHPYTVGLLKSVPRLDRGHEERLIPIEGRPPDTSKPIPGCPFAPRCAWAVSKCHSERPPLFEVAPGHRSACWRASEVYQARLGSKASTARVTRVEELAGRGSINETTLAELDAEGRS